MECGGIHENALVLEYERKMDGIKIKVSRDDRTGNRQR
jgi:hypothetical protein